MHEEELPITVIDLDLPTLSIASGLNEQYNSQLVKRLFDAVSCPAIHK